MTNISYIIMSMLGLYDPSIFLFTPPENVSQLPGYIYYKSSPNNSYISKVDGVVQITSENVEIIHSSYFDNTIIPSNYMPSFDTFLYGNNEFTDYNLDSIWNGTALWETGFRHTPLQGFEDVYLAVSTTEKLIGKVGLAMVPNANIEVGMTLHGRIIMRDNGLCVYLSPNEYIVENLLVADASGDGERSVQDIFDFLEQFFGNNSLADVNRSGQTSVQDIFDFLEAYFGI